MFDEDLYRTWRAMNDQGWHEENLRMLGRSLDDNPRDAEVHLLRAQSLLALDRAAESHAAVHHAIECGHDDAAVLVRAASLAFYAGDVATARVCAERAKQIAPQRFALASALEELQHNIARRDKGQAEERRLAETFDADPAQRGVATELTRRLSRHGQTFAGYHVVARADSWVGIPGFGSQLVVLALWSAAAVAAICWLARRPAK